MAVDGFQGGEGRRAGHGGQADGDRITGTSELGATLPAQVEGGQVFFAALPALRR